ncbi:hypothetical protein Val02_08130 [Virgisporangium aliadipatigenens]|uniref:Fibronectin type-III domain-containing protein n=1 Tax=Virgisporangium aliadipatigenens TaxID=741659 RepID=A0A8J3YGP8_9ACTN|nr:fibronectin type III domain-containing protein [Virgisporangium aliadipatigenens]GIJ43927.1 hypothetical protein Val02_08130 [Virgisporangium aliadipatigenens]
MNWKRAAKPLVAVAAGGTLLAWGAGVAMAGPGAPSGVQVTRGADLNTANLTWQPVEGAARYYVSFFDGKKDTVTVVPAGTTSMSFAVPDGCKRYRFNVAARDSAGAGTVSKSVWLGTVAPGPVEGLKATRNGSDVTVTWETPRDEGYHPITGYTLDGWGENYNTHLWPGGHSVVLPNVPATTRLTVRMSARNGYESCGPQAQAVVPAAVATPVAEPTGLTAKRDPADPRRFLLNWKAGVSPEHGAIAHYTVRYGYADGAYVAYDASWADATQVDVTGTSTAIDLPESWPEATGSAEFAVNAVYADGYASGVGPTARVAPAQEESQAQRVTVNHTLGRIQAELDLASGDLAAYPNTVMRISRADGYTAEQWLEPGTTAISMYDVPQGLYTIVVSGVSETGEQEWSRETAQIGGDMPLSAYDLASGGSWEDAEQTGRSVRVTAEPLRSADHGLAYDIWTTKFSAERGYGAILRGDRWGQGLVLRYEPAYTTTVDGQTLTGPGFTLTNTRSDGRTGCATRLAGAFAPPGTTTLAQHRVTLRAFGNTFVATVDGRTVLEVADLKALYGTGCAAEQIPTGQYAGFHVWEWQLANNQRDWTALHYSGMDPYDNMTVSVGEWASTK